MQLWNDFEGATLAGEWKLDRLLRTEGRSALFATTTRAGAPAVLRVTEALNDQAALHARFRAIQAAGDRFLVRVESFGDAELDGTPVSWAVLEPTQESLAEILATRRLDAEETLEVAQVVTGGLLGLHKEGLVHGRIEPESIVAAGQQIKLRSDCARPAPAPEDVEEDEDAVTQRTDAWGLANVIHLALTQKRLEDPADALALPEPYAAIVRNTAKGQWGVPEIDAELTRFIRSGSAARATAPAVLQPTPARAQIVEPAHVTAAPLTREVGPATRPAVAKPLSTRASGLSEGEPVPAAANKRLWALLAVGAAILILVLFFALHRGSGKTAAAQLPASPEAAAGIGQGTPAPAVHKNEAANAGRNAPGPAADLPRGEPPAKVPGASNAAPGTTASEARDVWRVVAYTYNRRKDADRKADAINKQHPNFKAEVWSRNDERPFLVTLGGLMPHDQALEMRTLAHDSGVAPDVYAQNYSH